MSNDLSLSVDIVECWNLEIENLIGECDFDCELMEVQILVGERKIRNFVARGTTKGNKWEAQIGDGDGVVEWFNEETIPIYSIWSVEETLLNFMNHRLKASPSTSCSGEKSEEDLASIPDPESFIEKEE